MYVFFNDDEKNSYMLKLLDSDRWYLCSAADIFGEATIILSVSGTEYALYRGNEVRDRWPDLSCEDVLEFFSAVVSEVYRRIESGETEHLDLASAWNALLPMFEARWESAGHKRV